MDEIQGVEAHQRASSVPHFRFLRPICDVIRRNRSNTGRSNGQMCVIVITEITDDVVSSGQRSGYVSSGIITRQAHSTGQILCSWAEKAPWMKPVR